MSLAPGTRLGAYEVLALIGAGGMGEVYRARDTKLNRDVALKILPDAFASDPERLARFTARSADARLAQSSRTSPTSTASKRCDGVQRAGDGTGRGRRPRATDRARPDSARRGTCRSRNRSPRRSKRRTSRASSIAISSRRTSRSAPDGTVKVLDFGLAKGSRIRRQSSERVAIADNHDAGDDAGRA